MDSNIWTVIQKYLSTPLTTEQLRFADETLLEIEAERLEYFVRRLVSWEETWMRTEQLHLAMHAKYPLRSYKTLAEAAGLEKRRNVTVPLEEIRSRLSAVRKEQTSRAIGEAP